MESAGTAEILRAAQKDTGYIDAIKSHVADIFQKCFGSQLWLKYNKWIGILCEIAYYSLTTLSLRQTLGEEYTGLLMISNDKRNLPTLLTRIVMVCLQCIGPAFIRLMIKKLEVSINSGFLSIYLRPKLKNNLLGYMPVLKAFPSFFLRLHLATFYLSGSFYHFSKRLAGIRYVLLRSWFGDKSVAHSFRLLGSLLLFNIIVVLLYSIFDSMYRKKVQAKENESEISVDPALQCPLCLSRRTNPSVTPCGHLFCWNCIHESLLSSETCPLCRHPCLSNEIVPLMNYV